MQSGGWWRWAQGCLSHAGPALPLLRSLDVEAGGQARAWRRPGPRRGACAGREAGAQRGRAGKTDGGRGRAPQTCCRCLLSVLAIAWWRWRRPGHCALRGVREGAAQGAEQPVDLVHVRRAPRRSRSRSCISPPPRSARLRRHARLSAGAECRAGKHWHVKPTSSICPEELRDRRSGNYAAETLLPAFSPAASRKRLPAGAAERASMARRAAAAASLDAPLRGAWRCVAASGSCAGRA
eukprot:scaffold1146_cov399-Prasinococcus_capsulatus_cf.AAC.83